MRATRTRTLGCLVALAAMIGANAAIGAASAAVPVVIWVDPVAGQDARSGATAATALRSLTTAWNRIPAIRDWKYMFASSARQYADSSPSVLAPSTGRMRRRTGPASGYILPAMMA